MVPARTNADPIYRIDRFTIPPAARQEFMTRVCETHELPGKMEGCLQNIVLEQVPGTGQYNIVTVVEWADTAALARAKYAVMAARKRDNFDPQ